PQLPRRELLPPLLAAGRAALCPCSSYGQERGIEGSERTLGVRTAQLSPPSLLFLGSVSPGVERRSRRSSCWPGAPGERVGSPGWRVAAPLTTEWLSPASRSSTSGGVLGFCATPFLTR